MKGIIYGLIKQEIIKNSCCMKGRSNENFTVSFLSFHVGLYTRYAFISLKSNVTREADNTLECRKLLHDRVEESSETIIIQKAI